MYLKRSVEFKNRTPEEGRQCMTDGSKSGVGKPGVAVGGGVAASQSVLNCRPLTIRSVVGKKKNIMSHTVTVTRTTTTTTTSAIIINTGYMKTFPGLLKLLEVVIGGVALGIFSFYINDYYSRPRLPDQFFLAAITTVFVASFCLLLSCLISLSTASIISKTIYELVYHFVAFLLILTASIVFLTELNERGERSYYYKQFLTSDVLGFILAALYLTSTVFAFRTYRGI